MSDVALKQLEEKGLNASKQVVDLVVETREQYDEAGEMFANVSKLEKAVKARKEAVTKPLNEALKEIRSQYKPLEDQIAGARTALRMKMGTYLRRTEEAARQEAAKVEKKMAAGTMTAKTAIKKLENIERVDNDALGIGTTTVKIVSVDWEKFDPTPYLANEKVRAAIEVEVRRDVLGNKAQGIAPKEVAGVTVTEQKEVTA